MSVKIEDLRFSPSSIDAFFSDMRPRKIVASSGRVRISSLQDLKGFRMSSEPDQLVHLSQQDFWHLGQDGEGWFIERMVSDDDGPVKG